MTLRRHTTGGVLVRSGRVPTGNQPAVTLLLVDDRDGRVIAELESPEQALGLLERMAGDDAGTTDHFCIVTLRDRQGEIFGTDSSVTIRPLGR